MTSPMRPTRAPAHPHACDILTVADTFARHLKPATYAPRTITAFVGGKPTPITIQAPTSWDDNAVATVAEKYLRRAGVPSATLPDPSTPDGCPDLLRPRIPAPGATFGAETSVEQAIHRLAGAWAYHAWLGRYMEAHDAVTFYHELRLCLEGQLASPNSPQWFNTGLAWAYGLRGEGGTLFRADDKTPYTVERLPDTYTHPQASACFIQSVKDDLTRDGGIMDLWRNEARVFKGGSGSGVNVSAIRAEGERLSGGGKSSGLMGFLKVGDATAGAVKSGGTTRRAAKMLCLDDDHPDILAFVRWKGQEELKVAALVAGSRATQEAVRAITDAIAAHGHPSPQAHSAITAARVRGIPDGLLSRAIQSALYGVALDIPTLTTAWEGEAYQTVSGQNSNNTVRLSDDFLRAVEADGPWTLMGRVDESVNRTMRARDLFDEIVNAAWASADPGIHYRTTIDDWHTCPVDGAITASNPCSEYCFLDNTACNLASLNLLRFVRDGVVARYLLAHAVSLWTVVLDVTVGMAGYPTAEIAHNSVRYRTLGLGLANLGALLMHLGLPYDSHEGRRLARALMALINAVAYQTSAQIAQVVGPYEAYERNRKHAQRVLWNHRACAALDLTQTDDDGVHMYDDLCTPPPPMHVHGGNQARSIYLDALRAYSAACAMAARTGLRNAQLTNIAPTGTIGFQLGCDTTGCEPDFALVKRKDYAGGGSRNLVNATVPRALENLGWRQPDIQAACEAIEARGYFFHADPFPDGHPRPDYLTDAALDLAGRVLACAASKAQGVMTLSPMAHVLMLAALQPHVSGAISKSVNLPQDATPQDIATIYQEAHKLGVKALAVYRDGCKLSQPLNLPDAPPSDKAEPNNTPNNPIAYGAPFQDPPKADDAPKLGIFAPEALSPHQAERVGLPALAESVRVKASLAGHSLYLHTGEYADGRLGEVFVTMGGQGGDLGAWIGAWAQSVSVALQHGTPFAALARSFLGHQANPAGFVHGLSDVPQLAHIRSASSPMDLIFQILAAFYDEDGMRRDRKPASPSAQPLPVLTSPARLLTAEGVVVDELGHPVEPSPKAAHAESPTPVEVAKPKGGGDLCPNCNHFALQWSGNRCQVCSVCHTTTGCS